MRTLRFRFVLLAALGVGGIASLSALAPERESEYAFFDPLIDVRALIEQRFVDEPDMDAMRRGAIRGMIEALDDPYTEYVPPRERAEFEKNLTGEYVGIGAMVMTGRDGYLHVVTPLEDSPAMEAGVRAGDRIVEIEGVSTQGKTAEESVEMLAGEAGTPVRIVIEREGERIPIEIVRRKIVTRTVKGVVRRAEEMDSWREMIDPERRIGYLRVTQFTNSTYEEFTESLERLGAREGSLGGLVLDLRGNPGGLFPAVVRMADLFLESGVIVSTRGRAHEERSVRAQVEGTLSDFPMVVLVNGQSASASEILAGALAEHGRAKVVGTRTFGKGRVQAVHQLPSVAGAELKVTEQRYYLPSGRSIDRLPGASEWGVDPSEGYIVPMTGEQFAELLRRRREQEVIRPDGTDEGAGRTPGSTAWSDPAWIEEELRDPQLAAALAAVQARIDTGKWRATGGENPLDSEVVGEELAQLTRARERLLRDISRINRRIEELRLGGGEVPSSGEVDLWGDEVEIEGGTLRVLDAAGRVVAELRITDDSLEERLIEAGVVPIHAGGG